MTAPIQPIQITPDQLKLALKDAILEANRDSRGRASLNDAVDRSSSVQYMSAVNRLGGAASSVAGHALAIPQTAAAAGGFQFNTNLLSREAQFQNLATMTGMGFNYERASRMGAAAAGTDLTRTGGLEQFKKELQSLGTDFARLGKTLTEATMAVRQFAQTSLQRGAGAQRGALVATQFAMANDLDPGMVASTMGTLSRYGSVAGSERMLQQIYSRRQGAAAGELLQATSGFVQQAALMGSRSGDRAGGMMAGIATLGGILGPGMDQTAARSIGTLQGAFQNDLFGFAMAASPGKDPLKVLAALQSGDGKEIGKVMDAMGPSKQGILRQMGMSGQLGAETALKLMDGGNYQAVADALKSGGGTGQGFKDQAEATVLQFDKTVAAFSQSVEVAAKKLVDGATAFVGAFTKAMGALPGADGNPGEGMLNSTVLGAGISSAFGAITGVVAGAATARGLYRSMRGPAGGGAGAGGGSGGAGGGGLIVPSSGGKGPRTGAGPTRTQSFTQGSKAFLRNMRSAKGVVQNVKRFGPSMARGLARGGVGAIATIGGGYLIDKGVEKGVVSGRWGDAMQGALTGASMGAMLGNPWTIAGGAIIGGLAGFFKGPRSKQAAASGAAGGAPESAPAGADVEVTQRLAGIEENTRQMVEQLQRGIPGMGGSAGAPAASPTVNGTPTSKIEFSGSMGYNPFDPKNWHTVGQGMSTSDVNALAPTSRDMLSMARGNIALPAGYQMDVTSTFRDPRANDAVGGVDGSRHTTGDAMDLVIKDARGNADTPYMNKMAAHLNRTMAPLGVQAMVHDVGSGSHLHMEYEGRGSGRDSGWQQRIMAEIAKNTQQSAAVSQMMYERYAGHPMQRHRPQG